MISIQILLGKDDLLKIRMMWDNVFCCPCHNQEVSAYLFVLADDEDFSLFVLFVLNEEHGEMYRNEKRRNGI